MVLAEKWDDVELVNVEFIGDNGRKFTRMLVIPYGKNKEEIIKLLEKEFPKVQKYTHIDIWKECFFYKGDFFSTSCET